MASIDQRQAHSAIIIEALVDRFRFFAGHGEPAAFVAELIAYELEHADLSGEHLTTTIGYLVAEVCELRDRIASGDER